MASSPPSSPSSASSGSSGGKRPIPNLDPISRTALRYALSPREYAQLHQYLATRVPQRVRERVRAPEPKRYARIVRSEGKKNAGRTDLAAGSGGKVSPYESEEYVGDSVRLALRMFGGVFVGLKGYEAVLKRLRGTEKATAQRNPNLRTAASLSGILLLYRLLFRFFVRLRLKLEEASEEAAAFRKRNPTVTKWLTSKYTPAVGAALSGSLLGISPASQLRLTIAIYTLTRSLEFSYNALALSGRLWGPNQIHKPSWFGSWLLMPIPCGILLHAFVFDRDCFDPNYARTIMRLSPNYPPPRPAEVSPSATWPSTADMLDALAELSRQNWPPFLSPILFPSATSKPNPSPSLVKMSPQISRAHPLLHSTSCALLHPSDPSCSRTYLTHLLTAFPLACKFFTPLYFAFALLSWRKFLAHPVPALNALAQRILRMSAFITASVGTGWSFNCFAQRVLPGNVLPTQRWFLGGFLGGLWAFVAGEKETGTWLYSCRVAVDCAWKVLVKRGWIREGKGADVWVFVVMLGLVGVVFEGRPDAVEGAVVRKALGTLKGEGWVDRVAKGKPVSESLGSAEEEQAVSGALDEEKKAV